MKKHRNGHTNSTNKPTVTLTGILSLPLRPGERAWIHTGHQVLTTSTVQKILEVSENGVKFETCNTYYNLKYETIFKESGAMCA